MQVSRTLASLDLVSEALGSGDISFKHASLIAGAAEKLREKFAGDAQQILVAAAKELDPARLQVAVMHLRHCVEPDGVLDEANEAHERRVLHLSQTFGGAFVLNGQFGADDGATLQTALDALMTAPAADDQRTASQRRADALVEVANRQLDARRAAHSRRAEAAPVGDCGGAHALEATGRAGGRARMGAADSRRDGSAHRL